jgi:hypothetical protein
MIRATFSTGQQNINEIVQEIMFLKARSSTNDSHSYLFLSG